MANFWRLHDRRYKPNIKKDLEDEDDDTPNTRLRIQDDLNQLYTGGEFEGGKTFSRMMSTLMVLITYSSGMPVLYIVGAVFFGLTYKVNKLVIIKFYQRTLSLNRVVPQYSMKFLSIVLFIHIIVGLFMLTNPSLFKTESLNGVGFKMPSLPVNPGE